MTYGDALYRLLVEKHTSNKTPKTINTLKYVHILQYSRSAWDTKH